MTRFKLVAANDLARSITDYGGPDLYLNTSTKIGRNVQKSEGLKLNPEWIQFSSNHCRVWCKREEVGTVSFVLKARSEMQMDNTGFIYFLFQDGISWFVEDTSTNGTWVNDVRVAKGQSLPVKDGDHIRLSTAPGDFLL